MKTSEQSVVATYLVLKNKLSEIGYEIHMPSDADCFTIFHYSDLPFHFSTIKEVEAFYLGLCETIHEPIKEDNNKEKNE
jgi:hypothetical protein